MVNKADSWWFALSRTLRIQVGERIVKGTRSPDANGSSSDKAVTFRLTSSARDASKMAAAYGSVHIRQTRGTKPAGRIKICEFENGSCWKVPESTICNWV